MAVLEKPVFAEPEYIQKPSRYEIVMKPLMDKPDEWAKIAEYGSESSAYQAASNLRTGKYRMPGEPEQWEFVANDNVLYARFISSV